MKVEGDARGKTPLYPRPYHPFTTRRSAAKAPPIQRDKPFPVQVFAHANTLRARTALSATMAPAVSRKLNGLIDAISDGLWAPDLQRRLDDLGDKKAALEAEIAQASASVTAPRLHPALAEVYRARVTSLRESLESEGGRETLEAARALIERLEISPPVDGETAPRIELIGHLTALLRAVGAEGIPLMGNTKSPLVLTDRLDMFSRSRSGGCGDTQAA